MSMAGEKVAHLPELGISTDGHIFPRTDAKLAVGFLGPLDEDEDDDWIWLVYIDTIIITITIIHYHYSKDKTKKYGSSFL